MTATSPDDLDATHWHLVAHRGADGLVPALTTPASTLTVANGRVSGTTGVNQFNADYRLDGAAIELGPVVTTLRAGSGAAMDQEAAVVAGLNAVVGYRLDDTELVLLDAGGDDLLRYEPLRAEPLLDTEWGVTSFRVADALTPPIAGSEVTITFAADGGVSGTTGCNRFHGQFTLDGDELALAPLATTRMMGAPQLMEQEMAFLSALAAIAQAEVVGGRLRLSDLDGATVVDALAR